tara:strand:- start:4165 stop:4677 length:513 start_codon:yes stop_codon:yes gene_type:complete
MSRIELKVNNLNFAKLFKNLDKIIGADSQLRAKIVAKAAKQNIKSGKFKPLSETTKRIRREGLSGHARNFKTTSEKPLIHTGRLLNSIKAVDGGVSMLEYGKYHLKYQQIRPNKWTKAMEKRNILLDFAPVQARNFLPITGKGNFTNNVKTEFKKLNKNLYKNIRRFLKD